MYFPIRCFSFDGSGFNHSLIRVTQIKYPPARYKKFIYTTEEVEVYEGEILVTAFLDVGTEVGEPLHCEVVGPRRQLQIEAVVEDLSVW